MSRRPSIAMIGAIAILILSCNDRTREVPPIRFAPVSIDAGEEESDIGPPPMPDQYCRGELDGATCQLPQGLGVCARERCVLVACSSGFGDCDSTPGCETPLSNPGHCGGCDIRCAQGQACLEGPSGFACASGVICPVDTFDLDDDTSNGCEWEANWGPSYVLAPIDLEIEAAGWSEGPIVAGGVGDDRISVTLGVAPQQTIWPQPRGGAVAFDVRLDDEIERVVWSDGVSLRMREDQANHFLQPECQPATTPRRFVGASTAFVATQFEVFRVDIDCPDGPCLQPVFGLADYQAQAFDQFGVGELATCDRCAIDLAAECWGTAQCRSADFDPLACDGCSPTGCPTLEIVDLVEVGELLGLVTARGVLLIDEDGVMLGRAERAFDPQVSGGPRFVAGLGSPDQLTLFHSTSFARVLTSSLVAASPDIGVSFDPEVALLAGVDGIFAAVVDDTVRLTRPAAASGRTTYLDLTTAPGIQGLRPSHVVRSDQALTVLYSAPGQIFTRVIVRR